MSRAWLYSFVCHTLDLPEWSLFPTPHERDRALADAAYGRMPGMVARMSRPFPVVILSAATLIGILAAMAPLTPGVIPPLWYPLASLAVYFSFFGLVLRFVHRPAVVRFLRLRLNELGVPVCRGCGYDLRGHLGLALDRPGAAPASVCPECGREWQACPEKHGPGA